MLPVGISFSRASSDPRQVRGGWWGGWFSRSWEFLNLLVSQKGERGERVPRQNERGVAPGVRFSFSTKLVFSRFHPSRVLREKRLTRFFTTILRDNWEGRGDPWNLMETPLPFFSPPPSLLFYRFCFMFFFTRNSRRRESVCTTDNWALRWDWKESFFFSFSFSVEFFRWKSFTRGKKREIIEIDLQQV